MSQQVRRSLPIFGIVPPYILDQIAKKGTAKQREAALRTKALDTTFRALRLATQPSRYAPHRLAAPLPMATPQKQRTIYTANHLQDLPGMVVRPKDKGRARTWR